MMVQETDVWLAGQPLVQDYEEASCSYRPEDILGQGFCCALDKSSFESESFCCSKEVECNCT